MAVPVITGSSADSIRNGSATDPASPSIPSGSSGDLLLLLGVAGASNNRIANLPTGWDEVGRAALDRATPNNTIHYVYCFSRVADGTEGSTVDVSPNLTYTALNATCLRISGAEDPATTAIVFAGGDNLTKDGSHYKTNPSVTSTDDDSLIIRFNGCHYNSATTNWVYPTSTTEIYNNGNPNAEVAYFTQATAGATGTEDVDISPTWLDNQWSSFAIAVAPAAGAASTFPMNYYQQMRVR